MFGIGMGEFLVILVVGLIVFGPKNLPEVGKALGKGLKEFRKAQAALSATLEEATAEPVKKTSTEVKPAENISAEEKISLDKKLAPEFSKTTTDKSADTTKENEISPPKELYTGTAEEKKSEEPARATVDDLITAVKENPISNKSAEEKISVTKEKSV